MEEDEEKKIQQNTGLVTLTGSTNKMVQKTSTNIVATSNKTLFTTGAMITPQCQIITHEASEVDTDSDNDHANTSAASISHLTATQATKRITTKHRFHIISKSAQNSSSSQEDYEPEHRSHGQTTPQYLSAATRVETARSMESLRTGVQSSVNLNTSTHHHNRSSFLTTSERDMRRLISANSVEGRALETCERERLKRRAISGEDVGLADQSSEFTAEKRRGLFASSLVERRGPGVPQHLSLPPPGYNNYQMLSPGDRRLTILSPHSPHHSAELLQYSQTSYTTMKTRRKKAIILPRLVLPRSDSEVSSDVFFDHELS